MVEGPGKGPQIGGGGAGFGKRSDVKALAVFVCISTHLYIYQPLSVCVFACVRAFIPGVVFACVVACGRR